MYAGIGGKNIVNVMLGAKIKNITKNCLYQNRVIQKSKPINIDTYLRKGGNCKIYPNEKTCKLLYIAFLMNI